MPGPFPIGGDFGLTHAQTDAVKDVFAAIARKKAAQMKEEMRESAKALGERRLLKFQDGNGGCVQMMVHPFSYHYWGNRLGYKCWEDPGFVREYLRDNPEARVRSRPENPTVVIDGFRALTDGARKRFTKTYRGNGETESRGADTAAVRGVEVAA